LAAISKFAAIAAVIKLSMEMKTETKIRRMMKSRG
jgi:hypothetical protein